MALRQFSVTDVLVLSVTDVFVPRPPFRTSSFFTINLVSVATTALGTVSHSLPATGPLFTPTKRKRTGRTDFPW